MTNDKRGHIYSFGAFRVDGHERLLFKADREIPLTPKVFDTLLALIENSSHVLTKKELMQKVWPDRFVEENNLAQNISLLRKALGESFIQTIPKRGYRFVADVRITGDNTETLIVRERTRARIVVERDDDDVVDVRQIRSLMPVATTLIDAIDVTPTETHLLRPPETMYARSGDVNIAYQVIGEAPLDLVFVMGWVSHLEYFWREPNFARFLNRLASFSRLILFDKRGTGLSDRVPIHELPTLEQRIEDVRAVMDAVGSKRAVLVGVSEGGPMCALFAATDPERTAALVMIGTYAKRIRDDAYPWAPTEEQREAFFELMKREWGGPVGIEERAPSMKDDPDFREWWATYLRMGASPGAAVALTKMNSEIDVRNILPSIRVPTLVIHRSGDLCLKVEEGRFVANLIPGCKYVELGGIDHLPFVGNQDEILDEIEEFLTGMRHAEKIDRVLATVMNVKIIDPQTEAKERGEADWQDLLERSHIYVRRQLDLFKGREVSYNQNGVLAAFDGPARAIRCAAAITDSAKRLGIRVKTGLHTGECDVLGNNYSGFAVRLAQQIAKESDPGEILVSRTVKDLVAGSGIS